MAAASDRTFNEGLVAHLGCSWVLFRMLNIGLLQCCNRLNALAWMFASSSLFLDVPDAFFDNLANFFHPKNTLFEEPVGHEQHVGLGLH